MPIDWEVIEPRSAHFVAIGGTGMGSLAGLLQRRGTKVTGSDHALYPPMSTKLAEWDIEVDEGFRPENVLDRQPDLVVIGNAVRADNPEARAVIDNAIPHLSFPDALYELAMKHKHRIVVSGTHGKTTTTSMIAAMLLYCDRDPSFLVGGIPEDFGDSFREGEGEDFVVEGDEYDTAFFDKTPKFLHYFPDALVITSLEFDHADIYRDLDHIKSVFRELVSRMPEDGVIFAAADHEHVADVVRDAPCEVVHYGADRYEADSTAEWRATNVDVGPHGTSFDIIADGPRLVTCSIPQAGVFNAENACAALAVARHLEIPLLDAAAALGRFQGVKRRLELRGVAGDRVIVDDFAHHPTAVRETMLATRYKFPGRRIIAVFEPRSNTSRRGIFQDQYSKSFDQAHTVVVRRPAADPIYSAVGVVAAHDRFDADRLVTDLRVRHKYAVAYDSVDDIIAFLKNETESGDVVLVMSNGGFDGIFEKLGVAFGGIDPDGLPPLLERERIVREAKERKLAAQDEERRLRRERERY